MFTPDPPTWVNPILHQTIRFYSILVARAGGGGRAVIVQCIHYESNTTNAQLAAAQDIIDNLEEQVTQLNFDHNVVRTAPTPTIPVLIAAAPPPTTVSPFRSEEFPDYEKFDDTHTNLPGFITQLRMRLEVNDDRFRNEAAKVIYAISRSEGRALGQLIPLVNANFSAPSSSVTTFVIHLEASFGNPDPLGTTRHQLVTLKEGKKDFATYYSQFLHIVTYLEYNEEAKIDALPEGLSEDLKDIVIYQTDRPNMVEAYAAILITIDNEIRCNLSTLQIRPAQCYATEQRYTFINRQCNTFTAEKQWRRDNNLRMYWANPAHVFINCPSVERLRSNQPVMRGALLVPAYATVAPLPRRSLVPPALSRFFSSIGLDQWPLPGTF
ncbi:uncharacterized protein H6S33_008260 [Morchella sextelata]|uniref:uncharacterized protein n=1 Tax=Morchella sextelata TaxID=1174677 RepID=UPI001D04019A|nr:uncharacterized protein H6S33_008260 [Morchella sextelata]KAH0603256.1 hypothetical protein H6S33_008260 [Morchella sextelata]